MNTNALAVRSARTDVTERHAGGATIGLIVCFAAALIAGFALVEAGSNASVSLIVLACLAIAWAVAGLIITVRQHCPVGSIVHAFAAAIAIALGGEQTSVTLARRRAIGGRTISAGIKTASSA